MLEDKNYDGIKTIIDEAMKAGTTRDLGHDYIPSLDLRLEESSRITVKTPWNVINDVRDGGLGMVNWELLLLQLVLVSLGHFRQ